MKRILEAVFEPHFYDEMMGFRPNRGCHQALSMLNGMIMYRTEYIVDADIRSFFDHMDHEWIIKFVESRIKDPNITRLIRRLLKAGIMNGFSYEVLDSELRETQTTNYFSVFQRIDRAVWELMAD